MPAPRRCLALPLIAALALPAANAARPPETTRSCIPLNAIRETRVLDDRTIDFVTNGRTTYRSTLPAPCPELGFERRFAYETSLSELCSTDIITVLRTAPSMRGASCGLGPFEPIMPTTR